MPSDPAPAPGDAVLWRSVYAGRVRFAMPHRLVEQTSGQVALHLAPGTLGRRFAGAPLHQVDDLESYDWSLRRHVWQRTRVLRLTPVAAGHSVDLFWDAASDDFLCWYVNLQEPLRRSALGFDTRDQALDIVVRPDRSWRWKDEDHLRELLARRRLTPQEGEAVGREAAGVVRRIEAWAPPFCDGWERWRPDPAWQAPGLPAGWDVVE